MDGCFLSVNHLFEESLNAVNDSMKTIRLPWLSEGLQGFRDTGSVAMARKHMDAAQAKQV